MWPCDGSEFGVLGGGGKWTDEPRCPECGGDMNLVRRKLKGRGCGKLFYSCVRSNDTSNPCKGWREPVNKTAARIRSSRTVSRLHLRDYQRVAVESVRKAFKDDHLDMSVISMATGAGKTSVANAYIAEHEKKSLVLWFAPACELLDQAEMNLRRASPHRNRFRMGLAQTMPDICELPRRVLPGIGATVFSTEQLFFRRLTKQLQRVCCPKDEKGSQASGGIPDLIVLDECHWGGLTKIGFLILKWAKYHGVRVLGLTATPKTGSPLPVVHSIPLVQLAKSGYLAWPRLWRVQRLQEGQLSVEKVFDMRNYQERVPREQLPPSSTWVDLTDVVDVYERNAEIWGKTLIKVPRIQYAVELVELCQQRGLRAETVNGMTAPGSRRDIIEGFNGDKLDILVVIGIGTFGLDVPALRTVFISHSMSSPISYLQLVGRGSRRELGIDHFNVVELHPALANMRPALWRVPLVTVTRNRRELSRSATAHPQTRFRRPKDRPPEDADLPPEYKAHVRGLDLGVGLGVGLEQMMPSLVLPAPSARWR